MLCYTPGYGQKSGFHKSCHTTEYVHFQGQCIVQLTNQSNFYNTNIPSFPSLSSLHFDQPLLILYSNPKAAYFKLKVFHSIPIFVGQYHMTGHAPLKRSGCISRSCRQHLRHPDIMEVQAGSQSNSNAYIPYIATVLLYIYIYIYIYYGTVSSILLLNTDLAVVPLSLALLGILAI